MTEQQDGGFHVRVEGGNTGQIIAGEHNVALQHQAATNPVDISRLTEFTRAVHQAASVLNLSPDQERELARLTTEILRTADAPDPDHSRLRTLGQSLRTVLEGAAAGALTSGLLGMWTP
ncbi:hypothetical protein [Streptomyces sp. T028]|uniref:hypothetical protein n=1 Tax=Streptomyces sp. T028 TaxID=3394379 RepID=UPI003A8B9BCC